MPDEGMVSREELTKRVLPQVQFSNESNPLTTPPVIPPGLSAAERAAARFAIKGNAVVTGGAGGIALSVSRALLEHGASGLSLFDLPSTLDSPVVSIAIQTLQSDFPNAKIITQPADVTNEKMLQDAVNATVEKLGNVDILLCFAGVVGTQHAEDIRPDQWRRMIEINATGTWLSAQIVGKQMIKQKTPGSIVCTASISGHAVNYPQPQVAYNASKAAVLHITRCLGAEWAHYGIRVNSISPGYMNTILNEGEGLAEARKLWAERNPFGRMGEPEELAGIVVMLCSGAGSYINATDIVVDGGGLYVY